MYVDPALKSALYDDGAVKIEGMLERAMLAQCRACFEWSMDHPSRHAGEIFEGTPDAHYNDIAHPKALDIYEPMLIAAPFADVLAELWDSEHIWFLSEEVFVKEGGRVGRSPWHQDTSYAPFAGEHLANCWLSFESLPKANALEIVRGSHHGTRYDGSSYNDPNDPTKPMWDIPDLPRLPDIETERQADPNAWDVIAWASEPGDVIICHSGALHGGAPVDRHCPTRNTLVLRFIGDDATYRALPSVKPDYFHDVRKDNDSRLKDGDPYRAPEFLQLR